MIILSIETSCDETGIALVEASGGLRRPQFKVIKNLIASQIKIHRPYGGVVPNLAKREHQKNLPILFRKIFGNSKKPLNIEASQGFRACDVDLIAVTVGPGLEPALWTGIEFARKVTSNFQFPISKLVGVNHIEGHLYSFLLPRKKENETSNLQSPISKNFPAIALSVSGGHTILLLLKSLTEYKKLGETRDDAAGEAFDKVARLLGLRYPGGPEIEKIAKFGDPRAINFPRPMINQKNYDFSFSGLKTAVYYYLRDNFNLRISNIPNPRYPACHDESLRHRKPEILKTKVNNKTSLIQNIAASFEQAVIDVLTAKTIRAAKEFKAKSVILCGGVAMNKKLRKTLKAEAKNCEANFIAPDFEYNTDNAAMIAAAAYINLLKGKKYRLSAKGDMNI